MKKGLICLVFCILGLNTLGQNLTNLSIRDAYPLIEKSSSLNFDDLKAEKKSIDYKSKLSLINAQTNTISALTSKHSFVAIFNRTESIDKANKTVDSLKKALLELFTDFSITKVDSYGSEKYILTKIDSDFSWYTGISIVMNPYLTDASRMYAVVLNFESNLQGVIFEPIKEKSDGSVLSVELADLIKESTTGFKAIMGKEVEDITGFWDKYESTKCVTGLQNCLISKLGSQVQLESYVLVADNSTDFENGYTQILNLFASALGSDYCVVRTKDNTGFNFVKKNKMNNFYQATISVEKIEQTGMIALKMNIMKP